MTSASVASKLLSKKQNDETKNPGNSVSADSIEHIIVIGNTGLGKSSLIKLLTNTSEIKTGGRAESCTTETAAYGLKIPDKDNNTAIHALIYDTQGTQDSKSSINTTNNDESIMATDIGCKKDCEILNDIQRFIYKLNGIKVKFIWVVPSMERMQSDLQRQAWFINKFTSKENVIQKNNNNNNNEDEKQEIDTSKIWDSVLIIVHKPEANAELIDDCANGAISAAQKYGNYTKWVEDENVIGYCNIEWLPEKRQKKAQRSYNRQLKLNDRTMFYYYKSNEIESIVLKSLLLLPSTSIAWRKDKCIKCDWQGDSRYAWCCDRLCLFFR